MKIQAGSPAQAACQAGGVYQRGEARVGGERSGEGIAGPECVGAAGCRCCERKPLAIAPEAWGAGADRFTVR
jgi:hypothetical protein